MTAVLRHVLFSNIKIIADMVVERNYLITKIVPQIRRYCREFYGIEFQLVDMRWGVQSEAQDQHLTVDLCRQEILHCQKASIGPNFVLFLGQKYGYIDLPHQILEAHFNVIRTALHDVQREADVNFVEKWYKKDSNAEPTVYVLQPIRETMGSDSKNWPQEERNLYNVLLEAMKIGVDKEVLPVKTLIGLTSSATHQEIDMGLFQLSSNEIKHNCLCYFRTITDLMTKLEFDKAQKYIDLVPGQNEINIEKYGALLMLKDKDIPKRLPNENLFTEDVEWYQDEGMSSEDHKEYLERFGCHFMDRMRAMITKNVKKNTKAQVDELYSEVIQHMNMAKSRCQSFVGRSDILDKIKRYALGTTDKPLVLYGASGNGKTSIMAKASYLIPSWMKEKGKHVETVTITRFCGTSASSSNIRQLLQSLCHQMAYTTGHYRHMIPTENKEIGNYFTDFVYGGEFGGIMFIFIDALDQLKPDDGAFRLDWLPAKLASNVKLIVSTLTEKHGILTKLKRKITQDSSYIEIAPLEEKLCMFLLDSLLRNNKRQISFEQRKVVKSVISQCQNPLFLKLTFEEILSWKSYTPVDEMSLGRCIEDCIQKLFDRLEVKHGKILVSNALAYITASRGGIGQSEIEDILSLDDEVLKSIFVFWEPPVRRLPAALWSRIHHDIASYLVEHEIDETEVLYWYHRQFIEAASMRYLNNQDTKVKVHTIMAEYYMGTWSGQKSKPFEYGEHLMRRKNIKERKSTAVRHVPEQPLIFDNSKRYNLRKLNQQPYHLFMANNKVQLHKEVYFNFSWLHAKLHACSIQPLIADYNLVNETDVNLVADALRMSESALVADPATLSIEITGRLLPHHKTHPMIMKLIQECDLFSSQFCPVVAHWQMYTSPGGPLQYVCEPEHDIKSYIDVDIIQNEDTLLLTAKPVHSPRMRIWDVTQGEPKPEMILPRGSQVYPTLNGKYINLVKNNRFLQTFCIESGELYGEVEFGHGNIGDVAVGNRYAVIRFDQAPGPVVVDIIGRANIMRLSYKCDAVAISNDDKFLVCNKGYIIILHELPVLDKARILVKASNTPVKITFSNNKNPQIYVMYQDKLVQVIDFDIVNKKSKRTDIVQDFEIRDFKLSHKQELLLVRAGRCLFCFNTNNRSFAYRIQEMPSGAFVEKLSQFKDAGFTKNDELLVAARYTYLGVWEAKSGKPLRLLQLSTSPIEKLFTSSLVNKTITLLNDNSIQVWDMNNLHSEVMHLNALVKGEVTCLDASLSGDRIIAAGFQRSEAKVFNNKIGESEWNLVHDHQDSAVVITVLMSPLGQYATTGSVIEDVPPYEKPWDALRETKVWNLATGQVVTEASRCRRVVWDPTDQLLVLFICKNYSHHDWFIKAYDAIIYDYATEQQKHIVLPAGSVVGEPIITKSGKYLAFIMQTADREFDPSFNYKKCDLYVNLYTYSFYGQWVGFNKFATRDILTRVTEKDTFIDIKPITSNVILVVYAKNTGSYGFTEDGIIDRSIKIGKGAFTFDLSKSTFLNRFDQFLNPATDIPKLLLSNHGMVCMDENCDIYHAGSGELLHKAHFLKTLAAPKSIHFMQNGEYYALITANRREVHTYRVGNDKPSARIFVHGTATKLTVGKDDRLIAVGCTDGRVMIFSAINGLADPYRELVGKLPSRLQVPQVSNKPSKSMLSHDRVSAHNNMHDLYHLSLRTKLAHEEKRKKPLGFRAIAEGVTAVQTLHKKKLQSKTCVVQ